MIKDSVEFDYSEIMEEANTLLKDAEERIKICLRDTNKRKEEGMPQGMDWKAEALGYKTSLECIKRTREKFGIERIKEEEDKEELAEGHIKYGCGHESNGIIIMDSNELSIASYLQWSESVGIFGDKSQCFNCWCRKVENQEQESKNG